MKYILMMLGTKSGFESYLRWSKEDLERNITFMRDLAAALRSEGVLVSTEGLAFPNEAKTVRAGPDGVPITDGVFPESKEFLAGYWIVDVDGDEDAYRIAARISAAPAGGGLQGSMPIEVRRIMSGAEEFTSE